jgi:hypothetical protein
VIAGELALESLILAGEPFGVPLIAERRTCHGGDRHQQAEMPLIKWLLLRIRLEIDRPQHFLEGDQWGRQ